MLRYRIVLFFPSIERSPTQKACCVVWVRFVGIVEESGVRQLRNHAVSIVKEVNCSSGGRDSTSAGEGLICGQVIGFADFELDERLSGCKTSSNVAIRAASVSISLAIVHKHRAGTIQVAVTGGLIGWIVYYLTLPLFGPRRWTRLEERGHMISA